MRERRKPEEKRERSGMKMNCISFVALSDPGILCVVFPFLSVSLFSFLINLTSAVCEKGASSSRRSVSSSKPREVPSMTFRRTSSKIYIKVHSFGQVEVGILVVRYTCVPR